MDQMSRPMPVMPRMALIIVKIVLVFLFICLFLHVLFLWFCTVR
jgi:hypothetical protein